MRSLMWRGTVFLLVLTMAGCSGRPAPSVHSDPDSAVAAPPDSGGEESQGRATGKTSPNSSEAKGYDLSSEGEAPETDDVQFEEDRLPPPPEEVEAQPLESTEVQAQKIEEMPAVAPADTAKSRIEPSVTAPVEPSVKPPVAGHPPAMTRGFRVQIAAVSEKSHADEVARVARTRVPEAVYVVSESSYYKVRVGDFHDRALALQLRDRLRAYGYEKAWVVTTEVMASPKDTGP